MATFSAAMAWRLLTKEFYVHEEHLLHVVVFVTYSSLPPSSYLVSCRTQSPTASSLSLSRSLVHQASSKLALPVLEEEEEGKEMMDISCDLDLRLRLSSRGSDVSPTDSGPVGSNGYSSLVVVEETSRIAYLCCGMLYPGRWSSRASRRRTSSNRSPYSTMVGSVSAMSRTSRSVMTSSSFSSMDPPPSPHPHPPEQLLINPGLAMKRSLRLFLQKRKSRSHSLSPYAPCPL
ncbi:hypothetical protein B296_00030681 [Ensete ventricosum]|uniref:Uncharacterized protein n=1 Tax=Ensete ventricosum TaxID=4639 RepID=A0A426YEW0_ENSVE|nr:hypothetical protein B296_00030681 [Ensete ventricosum]